MAPNINKGDVVILSDIRPTDVQLYDIIQYRVRNSNVVHRVVEIQNKSDELYFITKGDNNPVKDSTPIFQDQIVAKVLARIPYLGFPAIYFGRR